MNKQQKFFDFAAEVGLTKHIGGIQATEELLALCHISQDKYVLDVGCGAGATPVFITKRYGCRVVGVDILEEMVARSIERATRARVTDKVECRVADAQKLPFDDNTFDIVITESVTAFPQDKQKAVKEYARVTKPGGYVGLNETTWLKLPPPPEMIAWVSQDLGGNAMPQSASEWEGLMIAAGLKKVLAKTFAINVKDEARGILQRYGYGGMLGIMLRTLRLYARNPSYRQFMQEIQNQGFIPKNINEYIGYGFYVGQK